MPVLTVEELHAALTLRDLSDPAQGPHAVQLVVDAIRGALGSAWPYTEIWTRRDHPVVPLADNYDNLGYATDAVTREARYTRYVSENEVLRSHTSAMIPPALRELASSGASDVLMICAGICYRRDSVDWQHTGTPHQLDLWRISRNVTLGEPELEDMIARLVDTVLPGQTYRTVPAVHPYTIHGRQIDVLLDDQWIEIGECGVAAPHVLRPAGLDESLDRSRDGAGPRSAGNAPQGDPRHPAAQVHRSAGGRTAAGSDAVQGGLDHASRPAGSVGRGRRVDGRVGGGARRPGPQCPGPGRGCRGVAGGAG